MNSKAGICSNCGAAFEEHDRFCGECGQPVGQAAPSGAFGAEEGRAHTERNFGERADKNSTRGRFGRILVIGLIVAVVVGAGVWTAYHWAISRPVSIDTTQLLPQAGPTGRDQAADGQQRSSIQPSSKIVRGWLGIAAQDVPWEVASRIGMATPSGALVNGCEPGGPADRAGIVPGDVLLEMNGAQLANARDLRERVSQEPPGATSQFVVWREGSIYRASALVAERPPNLDRQKRSEARRYASAYEACFAKFCPGCNNPLDLFKEHTPECRQCEAAYKGQIQSCTGAGSP